MSESSVSWGQHASSFCKLQSVHKLHTASKLTHQSTALFFEIGRANAEGRRGLHQRQGKQGTDVVESQNLDIPRKILKVIFVRMILLEKQSFTPNVAKPRFL